MKTWEVNPYSQMFRHFFSLGNGVWPTLPPAPIYWWSLHNRFGIPYEVGDEMRYCVLHS